MKENKKEIAKAQTGMTYKIRSRMYVNLLFLVFILASAVVARVIEVF